MAKKHPLTAYRYSRDPPISRDELARKIGVSRTTVYRWEKRERFPEQKFWAHLRALTGLRPDELPPVLRSESAA